jgi:hypothetical protein
MVFPVQTGVLLLAVGVAGTAFTTTFVVPGPLVQPFVVTVTLYVPAMATVDVGRVGFCVALVNALGPVHAYVAPATVGVVKFIVLPAHTGVLLFTVGVAGVAFTTTAVVPAKLVQPFVVTVTLYVPAIAAVEVGRVGFCVVLVNALGPVHEYVAPDTVGVLKLMVLPLQTGVLLLAVGVAGIAFTTIVIALLVAGLPVTPDKFEVITHVTI